MTNSEYKLLVTDLDGTLLDNNGLIPEVNRRAIGLAGEKGVRTVICSGRSYMSLKYFEEQLGLNKKGNYGISFNGGIVYETHNQKKLSECRLKRSIALEIIEDLKDFDIHILAYVDDTLLAENESEEIIEYRDICRLPIRIVKGFGEIAEDFSKLLIKGKNDELKRVSDYMSTKATGMFNMFFSGHNLLEFCCLTVDKGMGLAFLLDYLNISPDECIAVGDHFNDIPMIKTAGLGVAVRNAESDVKQAAGYITRADNNEGAINEIVEKFII